MTLKINLKNSFYLWKGLLVDRRNLILRKVETLDTPDVLERVTLDAVQVAARYVQFLYVHPKLLENFGGEGRLRHSRYGEVAQISHVSQILQCYRAVLVAAEIQIVQRVLEAVKHLLSFDKRANNISQALDKGKCIKYNIFYIPGP